MGSGRALWNALHVDRRRGWKLYDKRGSDRQDLPDALLTAEGEDRLTFAQGLHEAGAMRKALAALTREVREDGIVGGELVVP
jgi:hypothetical protein